MKMNITIQDVLKEAKDITTALLEEDRLSPESYLWYDRLHEIVDGHEWVIYCGKANALVQACRGHSDIYDAGYALLDEAGGNIINPGEEIDHLQTRLAYWLLQSAVEYVQDEIIRLALEEEKKNAYNLGYARGETIVRYTNATPEESEEEDEDEGRERIMSEWNDAEENARQFSPFECTAKEFNDSPFTDEVWEAFEEGISDAFEDALDKLYQTDNGN